VAGLLERSRIPLWIIPEEFIAEAARRRGVSPSQLEDERDGLPGVPLRAGVGRQVMDEAAALVLATQSPHHVIPFDVEKQERELWCWVAVALSLAKYYSASGASKYPCQVVDEVLPRAIGCCGDGDKPACNGEATLEKALTHVGVAHNAAPTPAVLADVQPKIEDRRLLCLRVKWANNQRGHFAVISGWRDNPASLWIEDPAGYTDFVELAQLRNGRYRNWGCTWTDTHFTSRPQRQIRMPDDVWAQVRTEAGERDDVRVDGGVR